MFNLFFDFLHNFEPQPIILRLGFLNIYWYSCLIVLGLLLGLILVFKLSPRFKIKKDLLENLFFYLVIGGFLGARLYHVLSELPYYLNHPWQVFAIWQGGLGIYGAVVVGCLVLFWFGKKNKINFLSLTDLLAPSLILGQAIGRWGNYFNQEIFGKPTDLPWGIPIQIGSRPLEFLSNQYFHPTFLYESIWNFLIFLILIFVLIKISPKPGRIFSLYLIFYSLGRFFFEFLRTDAQPILFNMRLAQSVSLLVFLFGFYFLIKKRPFNKLFKQKETV